MIQDFELDKFLMIPEVEHVWADEVAEEYLLRARASYKPVDHGKKTKAELYEELKN